MTAYNFIEHKWKHEILPIVPVDIGLQLTSNSFSALCEEPGIKMVPATEYQVQINVLVKRFNVIMISRPRQYVAEHWNDCSRFVLLMVY